MKKLLAIIILILTTGTVTNFAEAYGLGTMAEAKVWICVSSNAYRFHNNHRCSGLCRCSYTIKEVTLSYAIEKKYTPCKICYKN